MSGGGALLGLLRRPAALAWVPLSMLVSVAVYGAGEIFWEIALDSPFGRLEWSRVVVWLFPALIGLLVGQAIKELQHCYFSWALPALHRRLLPGAVAVGLTLALATREILTVLLAPLLLGFARFPEREIADMWVSFPALSPGLVALSFMVFWIGVRPSLVSWLGIMVPLALFSEAVIDVVTQRSAVGVLVTVPLTALLICQKFGIESARSRPFITTQALSGGGRRADQRRRPWGFGRSPGAEWRIEHMGADVVRWVQAGVYENHGFHNRLVRTVGLAIPALAAAYIVGHVLFLALDDTGASFWSLTGVATGSTRGMASFSLFLFTLSVFATVPLSVLLACYASISLTRNSSYPLSRRQLAGVEFWGSLAENAIICGFLAALLLGFWSVLYGGLGFEGSASWPAWAGGHKGWIPFLLRPLAVVFLLTPIAQWFRLRYIRAPVGWSSVRRLVNVVGLMIVLTVLATVLGSRSFGFLPRLAVFVDGPFVVLIVLSQMAYRLRVARYFATADLV
jgi:hypothetical protein